MRRLSLCLLLLLAATWSLSSGGAIPAIWGCDSFMGSCRLACFARESPIGQKECAEGLLCCVPTGLSDFW